MIRQCSLDLSKEIARKARLHTRLQERAARLIDRDHLRRLALGEGTGAPRVDKEMAAAEMAAAERKVIKAEEKVAEAEGRREKVVRKIEEAKVGVLEVLGGWRLVCEHGLDDDSSDENGDKNRDAEMDDFSGADGDGKENGTGPAQD
ncbi:hypothetical protein QBC36DRAFT_288985 [Triangularia setosa]|uniref:Uncharacterized protein n=1 Tax=Triangularia setosa TaxID=2587417 RepID=A0AAN7A8I5_9PEZI|nr:hypothetical protein QBC36DRAFT_288985 [Podospora setosa]